MESFELAILSNVLWATVLALLALATTRLFPQRPGLAHGLWVLVLVRLIAPPLLLFSLPELFESFAPSADPSPAPRSAPTVSIETVVAAEAIPPADSPGPAATRSNALLPLQVPVIGTASLDETRTTSPRTTIAAVSKPAERAFRETARSVEASTAPVQKPFWTWRSTAAALWLTGTFAWGTAVVLQVVRLRVLLRSARPAADELQDRTNRMAARLGLRRGPGVWLVPARIPPMLWALGGPPRLLLPADLWDRLDDPQKETILAHELAHLRRRDHQVRWLEGVVLGFYWWNPIAWWARRQIEKAEEPCCDAWVVWALPESVDAYAEALVATAAFLSGSHASRPLGATGARRVTELRRRLTMILSDAAVGPIARAPRLASKWAMPFCLLTLVLLPVLAPGQAPKPAEEEASASQSPAASPAQTEEEKVPLAVPGKAIPSIDADPVASPKPAADEGGGQKKPREKGKGFGTSINIPRGKRVVSISAATHGAELAAGDRVDVIVAFRKETTEKGAVETRLLLESVEVFATEPTTRENQIGDDGKKKTSRTIMLLLTPEQVPHVKLAEAKGTISLKQSPHKEEIVNKLDESLLKELNEAVALSTPDRNAIPGEGQPPGPEMKIQQSVVRKLNTTVDFMGRFEAFERVELRARASGALLRVNAAAGTLVRRGDLLFEIDSRVYVAELRKAEAELARLEAQLRRRMLELERVEKLAKASAVSQEQVDRMQGDVEEAKAAIGVAQPDLELAKLRLEATRITAPIDGRFRPDRVAVGELVLEDKTLFGSIESVNPAAVRIHLDQKTFLTMSRPAPQRVEVLEFGLDYVAPSQKMAPIVEKLAGEGLPIRRVDGQKSPELADRYEITRYPTVILLVEGKETERHSGILSEEELRNLLAKAPRPATPAGGRGLLESGTEVEIGLTDEEGYPIRGKLDWVDTRINPETGTVECRALVPNGDGVLLPGMVARVRMEVSPPSRRICVPAAALVRRETHTGFTLQVRYFIRVVNDRDQVERREVILGQRLEDGFVVVASGLKEGEQIAVPPGEPETGSTY